MGISSNLTQPQKLTEDCITSGASDLIARELINFIVNVLKIQLKNPFKTFWLA